MGPALWPDSLNLLGAVHTQMCLNGRAYANVKAELHKHDTLLSVLAKLRMLFGKSEVMSCVVVQSFKNGSDIKTESLDSLAAFSMSIRNCRYNFK